MMNTFGRAGWMVVVATLLLSLIVPASYADDDEYEGGRSMERHSSRSDGDGGERGEGKGASTMASNPKWKEECGSCHLAYPPQFLSAESWRAVMSGLDKHFGSDASLDAAVASEIGDFLERNASTRARKSAVGSEPPLRISDTSWFKSEHREVSSRMWQNPKVKSPSNCAACHTKAETGSFNEHDVRMPR